MVYPKFIPLSSKVASHSHHQLSYDYGASLSLSCPGWEILSAHDVGGGVHHDGCGHDLQEVPTLLQVSRLQLVQIHLG